MKEIKAWECDHCSKYLKTKHSIKEHEKVCFKNPATQSCITCSNFREVWDDEGEGPKRNCKSGKCITYRLHTECPMHTKIIGT